MGYTIPIIIAIVIYIAVMLVIGYYAWKKNVKHTVDEYFLADRGLGVILLTGSMFATWFSTFAFIGGPATFYHTGVDWLLFSFFNVTGPILLWYFGSRIWALSNSFGHITPAQMVGDYYQSTSLRILFSIISLFAMLPYVSIQLSGVAKILDTSTAGAIPFNIGVIIIVLCVFVYSYFGGARAVVWTDGVQGFVFAIFILMTTFLVVNWAGGWFHGWEKSLSTKPEVFNFPVQGAGNYFTLQLLWTFGWVLTPHMWQRILMAKSPKVLGKTMAIATPISLWVVTFCGAVIGFLAIGLIPQLPAGTDADSILALLYTEYLPFGLVILSLATFAAGMSTVDSQLLTSSSTFTIDIYQPFNKQTVTEQKVQSIGKVFIAVFILSVMVLTLSSLGRTLLTTLASLGVGYALQFLPCLIGMIFWRKATKSAVFWGLLLGFIFMNLVEFTELGAALPWSFGGAFWGLLLNLIIFVVLSYITTPVDQKQIDAYHGYLEETFSRKARKNYGHEQPVQMK